MPDESANGEVMKRLTYVKPHRWRQNYDETLKGPAGDRCRLCGVTRGISGQSDPPEAALACPEDGPPDLPYFEPGERNDPLVVCRACGEMDSPGMWEFAGKYCPECGSHKGAVKATAEDRIAYERRVNER
jgi:hypothetical protein